MKYYVSFQQMGQNGRPIEHQSSADYETDETGVGVGLIPAVGDYVQIEPLGNKEAPRYSGRVASRLFRYLGDTCGVNIVVVDSKDDDWGLVIKA